MQFNGLIYVDQLSYTSSEYNRFFKVQFEDNKFDWSKSKKISGNKAFRKITSNFFHNNQNLLDNTLLSKNSKQKIANGEII
ncbi:MAG: type II toxin-antitoxin system RnlB family antitoxin [Ureaplasma sp.]|nr:type II toxin-antitoxin system RnlB family antitoxin [Ureaplasma sp.]